MQPEEVLKLIGSAPERYDTVRAALRYRGDGPTKKEIRERIARTEAGRRAFGISTREASRSDLTPHRPPRAGRTLRVALPGVALRCVPLAHGDGPAGRRGEHPRLKRPDA